MPISMRLPWEIASFYAAAMELGEPSPTGDDHLGWAMSNIYFGIDQVESVPESYPGAISIWFEVENLEQTYRRCLRLGATERYGPTRKPWGALLAAVYDPDGNVLGLAQRGGAPE